MINSILEEMAAGIAKMHDGGLIHGDLTTSNMMLKFKLPVKNDEWDKLISFDALV